MCLILSASSWVRRWLKCRTVLQWTRTFSYQRPIKSDAYASKATCKTICHLECVNIWTTRSCHFDWMSLQNAGQGLRSSDRAAVFGVCVGRWSDRSRYNWLTIDQDGGSLGNSPSPHVVSPLADQLPPFPLLDKGLINLLPGVKPIKEVLFRNSWISRRPTCFVRNGRSPANP